MPATRELGLVGIIVLLLAVLLRNGDIPSLRSLLPAKSGIVNEEDPHHVCQHHLAQNKERTSEVYCPVQPDGISVGSTWEPENDQAFRKLSYERLRGAIQIVSGGRAILEWLDVDNKRTETFDDMSMDATDPSFDVFYDLEKYLRQTFPLFHEKLAFEKINEHGLLFTWKGSKPDLKPVLLMAHQDVVPVNPSTWSQWTHPPFSGHLDEQGWVWGRGTTDMKGTLVALMASAEKLLSEGFEPERTILFSHGFDEEIGGPRGAKEIAKVILERYGPEGISIIVDEGFTGVDIDYGTSFARVGVAEKGCFSVTLSVLTEGGHSSRPPAHTGVGIMSRLLVEMENNPNLPKLRAGNPLLTYLECAAQYGEDMDPGLKAKVRLEECWPALADEFGKDRIMQTFLKTTQAIDIVNGGIKYNALPETVTSLTNYRIDLFETTQDTIDRLVRLLTPLADDLNMTFALMNEHPEVVQNVIRLETFGIDLEPAPLTPAEGPAWELIGGTIKNQFPDTVVVPSAMTAFTDTRWYWDVSRHIYRFVPASLEHILNYHTVNERIHMDAHMSTIKFFHKFIQNTVGWSSP